MYLLRLDPRHLEAALARSLSSLCLMNSHLVGVPPGAWQLGLRVRGLAAGIRHWLRAESWHAAGVGVAGRVRVPRVQRRGREDVGGSDRGAVPLLRRHSAGSHGEVLCLLRIHEVVGVSVDEGLYECYLNE